MSRSHNCGRLLFAALICLLPATPAPAQVVTNLHNFTGYPTDGADPNGALLQYGSAFYGMTGGGGNYGEGTIFTIGINGTRYGLLHSFGSNNVTDGRYANGNLVQAGGFLYGMTEGGGSGGAGTVFRINPDGSGFTILHGFGGGATDGYNPLGSPAISGGVLYGMTSQGGSANLGVVYRMNTDGSNFQVIHSFSGAPADGHFPAYSSLVVSGSTIYGMTSEGGTADQGAIFRMNTDGSGFAVIHSFVPSTGDGWDPLGSLVLSGSTLYGMTRQGGGGAGSIFEINTDGTGYARLHAFAGSPQDGANPAGTLYFDGTRLYGSTPTGGAYGVGRDSALGVLFGINPDGSDYQVLNSFDGGANGGGPTDVIEYNGDLYGMTGAGGSANDGIIYSFSVPEPSSLAPATIAAAGAVIARRLKRRRRVAAASAK